MTAEEIEPSPPSYGWRPLVLILSVIAVVAAAAITFAFRSSDSVTSSREDSCDDSGVRGNVALTVDGSPAPDDLRKAAAGLKKRLAPYDCDAEVSVTGDRLQVAALKDAVDHLDSLLAPGRIEFREVLQTRPATNCTSSARALSRVRATDRLSACSQDGTEQLDLLPAAVVGADVQKATAERDQQLGEWQIIVHFTEGGQKRWTGLTARTVGKRVAIVLDGVVLSAPNIQERIEGDAQITGSFSEASAKALAAQLSSGALPVTLRRG